jgi:hypothetical protein
MAEVKQHAWCCKVKWDKLLQKKVLPPFKLNLRLSSFDPECTSIALEEPQSELPSEQLDSWFLDFDFSNDYLTPRSSIDSSQSTTHLSFLSAQGLSQEAGSFFMTEDSPMSDEGNRQITLQIPMSPSEAGYRRPRKVWESALDLELSVEAKPAKYLEPEEHKLVQRAKYIDHSGRNSPWSPSHSKLSHSFSEVALQISLSKGRDADSLGVVSATPDMQQKRSKDSCLLASASG